ncbi:MAG: HIT domain-containing protein [Candidatus Woesearchaeota archaeon]|jgi:histidine triad (HIT) family protein
MAEDDFDNMTPEQIAQAQKDNCIFCKIINGDIPSKKVYEDPEFIGILDINPAADGHVLLLPKKHFQILPQLPPDLVGSLGIACSNISLKILKSFKCEGTTVFLANGAVAGQRAPHFMVHIIPRRENDDLSINPDLIELDESTFITIREKIFAAMKPMAAKQQHIAQKKQEIKDAEYTENYEEDEDNDDKKNNKKPENKNHEEEQDNDKEDNIEEQEENIEEQEDQIKKAPRQNSEIKSQDQNKPSNNNPSKGKIDYDKLARMLG